MPLLPVEIDPWGAGRGRVGLAGLAKIKNGAFLLPRLEILAGSQTRQPALGSGTVIEKV